jgi:phosphopantetheine adenylyltransferase
MLYELSNSISDSKGKKHLIEVANKFSINNFSNSIITINFDEIQRQKDKNKAIPININERDILDYYETHYNDKSFTRNLKNMKNRRYKQNKNYEKNSPHL